MKQVIISCALLLLGAAEHQAQAQRIDNTEYNLWYANPGDTFRVYGKIANVRTRPGKMEAITDSLPCGTPVIIKEQAGHMEQLKGIYAPWVKIRYGTGREGYMWLGMLALGSRTDAEQNTFLYGLDWIAPAVTKEEDYQPVAWHVKAKALDAQLKPLDEKEFVVKALGTSVTEAKLLGDMGLEATRNIWRIQFGGEACGIPTDYFYFGWTGRQLLPLPGKSEVGDAGVFYHSETLLFPKEPGGQLGRIIRLAEEGEADEEKSDPNGEPVFKVKKTREVYTWDGSKARKQ